MFRLGKKEYKLVKIGLVRAACPREVEQTRDNLRLDKAIVVDANAAGIGRVHNVSYVPKCIVVAGAARRKHLLSRGVVKDYAFVAIDAMEDIHCDDEISSSELMQKLSYALKDRILGPGWDRRGYVPGQESPYISEVYPFENYFIYSLKGDKYRQRYFLDPVAKSLHLTQGSQKVEEKYVDASARKPLPGELTMSAADRMPMVQTGLRPNPTVTPGNDQTVSPGATNCELVTQIVRNWKNVLEAVSMYLAAIRNGQHKPPFRLPAFAPVDLQPNGKLAQAFVSKDMGKVAACGLDVCDFAQWSAKVQAEKSKKKVA
jgi:hypothetical protein